MGSLFDSKVGLGAAGIAAAALGVLAVVHFQRAEPARMAPQRPAASAWDSPIGPGLLAGPARESSASGLDAVVPRGPDLATDASGHLVPDDALRKLADSYLVHARGAERRAKASELRAVLSAKLHGPAVADAARIVSDYASYLETEEQLIAGARLSPPGPGGLTPAQVEHLLAWQQQRAQLRERMLGTKVARAWFEADDAACTSALRDWQKLREPADSADIDSNELQARRLHGAALEERRNYYAQDCAGRIIGDAARGG